MTFLPALCLYVHSYILKRIREAEHAKTSLGVNIKFIKFIHRGDSLSVNQTKRMSLHVIIQRGNVFKFSERVFYGYLPENILGCHKWHGVKAYSWCDVLFNIPYRSTSALWDLIY